MKRVNLFKLMVCLLERIPKNLMKFSDLRLLDASLFEHFNYTMETFIKVASVRKDNSIQKAVSVIDDSLKDKTLKNRKLSTIFRHGLQGIASVQVLLQWKIVYTKTEFI